ncbi:MAG: autotransporter outer membrane beta-barrel domain-containing protein, partial [Opitutaceae bacterium]|nr:autotransporter outer membrane beta-barrel domain-containing protein [Opitutaceae bacterium]
SPGNSYGRITFVGAKDFSGATFDIEIDPTSDINDGDRVIVTDTATVEGVIVRHDVGPQGSLLVDYVDPSYKWLILRAKTIDGEFVPEVETTLLYLTPELSYGIVDPDVYPEGTSGDGSTDLTAGVFMSFRQTSSFGDYALTRNERATASALETLSRDSNLYKELLTGVTKGEERAILNALSGEPHVSVKTHLARQDDGFMRRFLRHAGQSAQRDAKSGRGNGSDFWIDIDRTRADADGNHNAARATLHGTEISGGHDAHLSGGGLAGVAFRLGESRQEVKNDRNASADLTTGTAAFYVGKERILSDGTLRVLFSGAFSRHGVESKRKVRIGQNTQKLETTTAGTAVTAALETAYRLTPVEEVIVEPYAALTLTHLHMNGFKEKGGSAALNKKGDTWTPVTSTLGVRFSTPLQNHVSFDADIGWQHRYGTTPKSVFTFNAGSAPFKIRGADLNRNAAILGLGVGVNLTDKARIGLRYDGELSTRGKSHQGQVVFEMKW